ncbi:hypothetical protein LSTR_LSTR014116 [Laodelphax striatellus]|uniref:EGF-like domain-containing protein n=1 Tax=Laodelphax striatellus TaxID=195883 RepID=A0A482WUD9_LAOST|nr:hypothetical protein LSTR_LSTR014116 [Laodelphax striatellus]
MAENSNRNKVKSEMIGHNGAEMTIRKAVGGKSASLLLQQPGTGSESGDHETGSRRRRWSQSVEMEEIMEVFDVNSNPLLCNWFIDVGREKRKRIAERSKMNRNDEKSKTMEEGEKEDIPKGTLDYKSNSSCSSPSKMDIQKNHERCSLGFGPPVPVLPVRNNLRRPGSTHHFPPPRFQFQKSFASRCTWKCTAIVFIILSLVLTAALTYISIANILHWSYNKLPCSVLVEEETSETLVKPLLETSAMGGQRNTSARLRPSSSLATPGGGGGGGGGGAKTFPARSFPPDGTTFSQIVLGQKLTNEIAAYGYWNMQFYQSEAAYVKFDYNIPRGASIAVYGRRNALPTHTQYHILEVLSGFKARTARASHSSVKKEVTHYLEPGHWFLSLYNDDGDPQQITFVAAVSQDMTHNCPSGCSGKGACLMGHCQCNPGFGGDDCSEMDCPHPTCSGHGVCAEGGLCLCKKGWKGADCAETDQDALQCLPDCSGHGAFDLETQTCQCEPLWTGDDCSRELCDLDCGPHGHCVADSCICNDGWGGECNEHGQCKNGTCLCVTGWNGRHCTMEGCPNSCSGHGQCRVNLDSLWECRCSEGWDGADCSVLLEQSCSDGRDNDKDGLVDCEDPECCSNHLCRSSQLCVTSPKPIDILLRKQPPAITASFFERMKFLIEEGSLQNYARQENFNESRSAVVRGRVVTNMGMGLVGVRVSTSIVQEGFTLTREDGWFDLLVNGGGAVTLQFGRSPYRPQTYIVNVPWNEVVIIDTVRMYLGDDKPVSTGPHACRAHDYDLMKPVVLATWKHGFQGSCPDKSAILAESQVVQESFQIPGTGLNLVYHSSEPPATSRHTTAADARIIRRLSTITHHHHRGHPVRQNVSRPIPASSSPTPGSVSTSTGWNRL